MPRIAPWFDGCLWVGTSNFIQHHKEMVLARARAAEAEVIPFC